MILHAISEKKWIALFLTLLISAFISKSTYAEIRSIEIPSFSSSDKNAISSNWKPYGFDGIEKTQYSLINDNKKLVIKANSKNAASGLIYNIRFNPLDYPYIIWSWKLIDKLKESDGRKKSTDDYSLRVYINFDADIEALSYAEQFRLKLYRKLRGESAPLASLNYIWEKDLPKESILPSPYTDRVQMLVLQNKHSKSGVWYTEKRNIVEDYMKAFGQPPGDVISIAIMSDSDNTEGHTQAYYGDFILIQKK